MRKPFKAVGAVFTLLSVGCLSSAVHAESYVATRISHIATNSDGSVFLKWIAPTPSPRPSRTCGGENFGWVKIRPAANEAIKALALSIHFSNRPARIDTSGCDGSYEIVTSLYSPEG